MANAKMTREEILAAASQIHLDEAWEIREEMDVVRKRANANKSALHDAAALGHLTDEQFAEFRELYPEREAKATPAERVEKLREQLAKAEEKAAAAEVEPEPEGDTVDDAVGAAA